MSIYENSDFDDDFTDEELDSPEFDPTTQSYIKYGGEEYAVTSGQTLGEIIKEYQGTLGVRDLSRLGFVVDTTYVTSDYVPKAGEVIKVASKLDEKG